MFTAGIVLAEGRHTVMLSSPLRSHSSSSHLLTADLGSLESTPVSHGWHAGSLSSKPHPCLRDNEYVPALTAM